ncbi:DUF7470 family protein [Halapricum desulfuricans]|uniref:Putative membrane protein n=1 Tax=Halapricum desulfuricans TaxID=2841257 RepID=A0A897MX09_9EURY|nr:hypothetical protein [Halapricum desulfuricans]QSG04518.1 putative membrane protein [Halapricum desulfuricans]QSG10294.1 putative membrane protein [Halapricum desulfuricans]QSG10605.1 putative membrane protein [Halapricum desulfuricans]
MLDKLGAVGIAGIVVSLAGLGVIAYEAPLIAAGVALVLAGLGLAAFAVVRNLLSSLGMGAMV